jgi:Transposase DDE domain
LPKEFKTYKFFGYHTKKFRFSMTRETKGKYRIRNWSEYNKALIQRGSITLWFSEDAIDQWHKAEHTGKKGRPQIYSDEAILCALLIRAVYHKPLRALEGFLRSMVILLQLTICVPSYTQICRRAKDLGRALKKLSHGQPRDIIFDTTGLKVYGEGEWKVRQHGISKRRTWRKLHIGMDPDSGEIIVAELTSNGVGAGDGEIAEKLIEKAPKGIKRVFGDGAYDGLDFRRKIESIGAEPLIPPPRDAIVHRDVEAAVRKRDYAVLEIIGSGADDKARKLWKKLKGYHRRSLVETTMYRIKQLTGSNLRHREWSRQCTEAYIKCLVINKMTKLGMPIGEWEYAA